jgi:prolyl-tRNA synthetase
MLPLGLRVQEKLERLIDKHMRSIKASKVALSSISSQKLWEQSGRLQKGGELFAFSDRKGANWLLAPTHEEEITSVLARMKLKKAELPLRLYQIGRKYRDEKRPRSGLLRGREFLMKDLYTFDHSVEEAHKAYDEVRQAYRNFLNELKLKYVEARAISGDMGGDLSHEYHLPHEAGEDVVITCSKCDYARNEEFTTQKAYAPSTLNRAPESTSAEDIPPESQHRWVTEDFLTADSRSLIRTVILVDRTQSESQKNVRINPFAVKAAIGDQLKVDTGIENPLQVFQESLITNNGKSHSIYLLLDSSVHLDGNFVADMLRRFRKFNFQKYRIDWHVIKSKPDEPSGGIHLQAQANGDPCPQCQTGKLKLSKAIEVGHTFYLGTRYSQPFDLIVHFPEGPSVPVEMGCHGIGVSRLIAASAGCLSDNVGLNWPRVIAPYEVLIALPKHSRKEEGGVVKEAIVLAQRLYDELMRPSLSADGSAPGGAIDTLIDDRENLAIPYKLMDADVIGYPVIVIFGKTFSEGKVEIQCRRLKIREDVEFARVVDFVRALLKQL